MKLGVPSKSTVLEPMHYDVRVLKRDANIVKVRTTWLTCFKVLNDLYLSFPSLTPIS
jgi:hypothetical protein